MNNRQHIQKKHPSQSTYTPVQNLYQTRAFDIQQQPSHSSSGQENVDLDADHEQSQYNRYNLPYIPVNAPGTEPPPPIQTQLNSGEPTNYYQQGSADVPWYNRPTYPNIPVNAPGTEPPPPIQTKLTIGEPGDKYEQEADQVASQVVQQINSPVPVQSAQGQTVQREDAPPEEEEQLQAKSISDTIQREEVAPFEEELQMSPMLQRQGQGGMAATPDLETSINQARGGGMPLAENLQRSMGKAMGADFSGVKVHTDSQSDQLNKSIQARAFTTGQDVFFRQGEYNPGSRGGQELLAHELTHVVQQNRTLNTLQSQSLFSPQIQRNGEQKDNEPSGGSLRPALGKELMSNMFGSNWFATGVFKTMNFAMYMEGQKLTQEHHNVLHQSLIENKSGVLTTLINENPHVMKSQGSTPIYLLGKYLVHKPLEYYLEYKNSKKD